MAELIQGVFPEGGKSNAKQDDKSAPSYLLHISITFSDPLIWRRIRVPGKLTLAQLHHVIQQSMGWQDTGMHQFTVGKISFEPTMSKGTIRESKRFDENRHTLDSLEEGMLFMFTYFYDAGDGWEHEIRLEKVIPPSQELKQSEIIAGEMNCPPEKAGDIHQYHDLQSAMGNPGDREANRLFELTGNGNFDPTFFDLKAARQRLATLNY